MKHTGPDQEQERLLRENEDLKRQLHEMKHGGNGAQTAPVAKIWRPSAITIWAIFLVVTVLIVVAFFSGYIPLQKRRELIAGESHQQQQALPRVEVIEVGRSSDKSELELPGNIEAITEAPILARADGYIQRRIAD